MPLKTLENRIIQPMVFELVRDRIAEILVTELAHQEQLAIDDGDDPTPYQIAVTVERTDPWNASQFPIVNIWYDTGDIDLSASSPANKQQGNHFYNLDCYVNKPSEENAGVISTGDYLSAKAVQQTAGIIWQIIMADRNARLQFQSVGISDIFSTPYELNAGNGTVTDVGQDDSGEQPEIGNWMLTCVESISDSGRFKLVTPCGQEIADDIIIPSGGGGNIVFPRNENEQVGLTFRLSDGTIDFAVDDYFIITVEKGKADAIVAHRMFENLSTFQPSFGDTPVENVQALRLRLNVRHVEIPPVTLGVPLQDILLVLEQSNRTKEPKVEIGIQTD